VDVWGDRSVFEGEGKNSGNEELCRFGCGAEISRTVGPSHLQGGWDDEPRSWVRLVVRHFVDEVWLLSGLYNHPPKTVG
jgi:hypothetical protein